MTVFVAHYVDEIIGVFRTEERAWAAVHQAGYGYVEVCVLEAA